MYIEINKPEIEKVFVYQEELRRRLKKRLKGTMSPTENVLYFPQNLDVRICPKNGMSSLKWALIYCLDLTPSSQDKESLSAGTKGWRIDKIREFGCTEEMPYRENSLRITIARDPIKRFMSACEYMKTEYMKQSIIFREMNERELSMKELKSIGNLSDVDIIPETIDEVIESIRDSELNNTHFYTQAYYLGNRSQYDKIYNMSEMKSMLNFIREHTKTSKKIDKIHSNKTDGLHYGSIQDLTQDQKKRIMRLYEEDYDYGWTEDYKSV